MWPDEADRPKDILLGVAIGIGLAVLMLWTI
jgi:hypothetical protein